MSTVATEAYWTVYWSYKVRGFDVLENIPFRKLVVDTQSSQKMISPENTLRELNHEVGIGTFINKYNWNDQFILSYLSRWIVSFRSQIYLANVHFISS